MAEVASFRRQSGFRGLPSALSSVFLEWLLILLLFVDACFSYMVTKFAWYCKLKSPCILCSRLDHILGKEQPDFYKNLICDNHKSEIYSWCYCQVHKGLSDVNKMCHACRLSFLTEGKAVGNRELVREATFYDDSDENFSPTIPIDADYDDLHLESFSDYVVSAPLLCKDHESASLIKHCSCCTARIGSKLPSFKNKLVGDGVDFSKSSLLVPDSFDPCHLGKMVEKSMGSPAFYQPSDQGFDRLCHVGYSEVNVTSDNESEILPSEDGEENHDNKDLKEDVAFQSVIPEIPILSFQGVSASDVTLPVETTHPLILVESAVAVPEKTQTLEYLDPLVLDLEQLNWNEVKVETKLSPSSEATLHASCPELPNAKFDVLIAEDAAPVAAIGSKISPDSNNVELESKTSQIVDDSGHSLHVSMDLNDAYKLAIGNKATPFPSLTVAEILNGKDFSKVHEDLKILLSQVSGSRGSEFQLNDLTPSPRVHGLDFSDASSSIILQNITKTLSIERNESGTESLDGSLVSEIEGETPLDRLNRQIEIDRKSISLLYKELEEERSASTIAANQAMAMITRLQEEKAAMQMEALQYQRMMEEQAEYDQEALQKSSDLLTQREKEIQDLEAELETYKNHISFVTMDDGIDTETRECGGQNISIDNNISQNLVDRNSVTPLHILKPPTIDIEDEKVYIKESLKRMEKKLLLFYNNVFFNTRGAEQGDHSCLASISMANREAMFEKGNNLSTDHAIDTSLANGHIGGNSLSEMNSFSDNGNHDDSILSSFSGRDGQNAVVNKYGGFATIKNDFSQLNDRLLALQEDWNFLEHAVNALNQGNDGLQFIVEIACHLRELRRVITTCGCVDFA